METIALINHKGGVAKTTTCMNLSAQAVIEGKKVLMVDTDPQEHLSNYAGIYNAEKSIYDAFKMQLSGKLNAGNMPIYEAKNRKGLYIIPSSLNFSGIEMEIAGLPMGRESILKNIIGHVRESFDYCFIDCPPSLGVITVNAMTAADSILIPLKPEFLAYRGLNTITEIISMIKSSLNPNLVLRGVFFTEADMNRVLSNNIKEKAKVLFGSQLYETIISRDVALAESPAVAQDIFAYSPKSKGAKSYKELYKEIGF